MTYDEWFQSQQGIAYDGMWAFARVAWGEQEKTIEELRTKLAEAEKDVVTVGPIDYDSDMDRYYIPVHPKREIQTQGKGSSFRIANCETGDRWLVTDKHLHAMLEQMARDIHSAMKELKK